MDIKTRKINFVKDFLSLSDERIIDQLEKVLYSSKSKKSTNKLKPMTIEEFESIIDLSEKDHLNGKTIDPQDILNDIEKW